MNGTRVEIFAKEVRGSWKKLEIRGEGEDFIL